MMKKSRKIRFRFIHILVTDVTRIGPKNIYSLIKGPLLFTSFTSFTNVNIFYLILFFLSLSHELV